MAKAALKVAELLLEVAAAGLPVIFAVAKPVGLILDFLLAMDERLGLPLDLLFPGSEPGLQLLPLNAEGRALLGDLFREPEEILLLLREALLLQVVLLAELLPKLGDGLGHFRGSEAPLDLCPKLLRDEPHLNGLAVGGGDLTAELLKGGLLLVEAVFAVGQAGAALLDLGLGPLAMQGERFLIGGLLPLPVGPLAGEGLPVAVKLAGMFRQEGLAG